MAGTNVIAARVALITALQALEASTLTGVKVDYSYVGKNHTANREYLYGGDKSEADVALSAMRGTARLKREESPNWTLIIHVTTLGEETTQDADTRAVAIGAVVENYLAATPTLGVSGLLKAVVNGFSLMSWVDDDGAHAVMTYQLTFDSYLG